MRLACNTSIVVITHNRTNFISRMASTLNELYFGGDLIIAESSPDEIFKRTKAKLSELRPQYGLCHIHVPKTANMSISQSMNKSFKRGIQYIETDYAMLTCDDDIPIPTTLDKFEKFLDLNSDYNGVIGDLPWYNIDVRFTKANNNIIYTLFGLKERVNINNSYSIASNTAAKRVDEYINKFFHTMFSVVRTHTYNNIIPDNAYMIKFPHFCADYNWMFGIALTGRIEHFSIPHVIRQYHGNNLGIKNEYHPFPSYLESLLSENWGKDANMFVNNMANLIANIDNIPYETAFDIALNAFKKLTILRLGVIANKNIIKKWLQRLKLRYKYLQYRSPLFNQYRLYKSAVTVISGYPIKLNE